MKKKRITKTQKARIIAIGGIAVIVLAAIALAVVLITKFSSKLTSIALTPDFTGQELDINSDYTFTVTSDPADARLKNLNYLVDTPAAIFSASSEAGKASLHTASEGVVAISIQSGDITSNVLTFTIVDQAAKEAAASHEPDAGTEPAAETDAENTPESTEGELVMSTDTVKVRETPGLDGEVISLCPPYTALTRYSETEDGWSVVEYEGQNAYIKSDYLKAATEEEIKQAQAEYEEETKAKEDAEKEAEKETEQKPETADNTSDKVNQTADAGQTPATAPEVPATAPVEAPAPAAEAPAPAPTGTVPYTDKNGASCTFTTEEWNYFLSYWDYTGQAEYFVHKHTCAELRAMYDATH